LGEVPRAVGGRCLCGAVAYEALAPLRAVVNCHCGMCRRHHGHVGAYTAVESGGLRVRGERDLTWFASSETAERGFCRRCGFSLFFRPRHGRYVAIAAGSLDSPTGLSTARRIHVADRGDYYEITDDLEREP
jgi:hypothetical protein